MFKMTISGKHHCDIMFVAKIYGLFITYRATGLNDNIYAFLIS